MRPRSPDAVRVAITPLERVVTAGIAAAATAAVAACVPLAAVILLRDHALGLLAAYLRFSHWGLAVSALAGGVGFACGAERTIVLSHHLLQTARSRDPWLTAGLWAALLLCAGASTWLI